MRQPTHHENEVFESLRGLADKDGLASLRAAVKQHLRELEQAARQHEFLATDLAEELADKLDGLLGEFEALPEDARPLVVGVARYFVSYNDVLPDRSGPLGLDDDVAVFNAAMRRIGRADLEIAG